MMKTIAACVLALGLGLLAFAGGCGSDDESKSSTANSNSGGGQCETACDGNTPCPNIVCDCKDGTPVNTSSCSNSCCEKKDAACPDSCASHGGWAG